MYTDREYNVDSVYVYALGEGQTSNMLTVKGNLILAASEGLTNGGLTEITATGKVNGSVANSKTLKMEGSIVGDLANSTGAGINQVSGTVTGNVTNNGEIAFSTSDSSLTVEGNYTQGNNGVLDVLAVQGGNFSVLVVKKDGAGAGGTASLAGQLKVSGNTVRATDTIVPVEYVAVQGAFTKGGQVQVFWQVNNSNFKGTYKAAFLELQGNFRHEDPQDESTPLAWYEAQSNFGFAGGYLGGSPDPVLIAQFYDLCPYIDLNDPEYRVVITVDWGDGSSPETVQATGTAVYANHIYSSPGTYTMTITVRDIATGTLLGSVYSQGYNAIS